MWVRSSDLDEEGLEWMCQSGRLTEVTVVTSRASRASTGGSFAVILFPVDYDRLS